MALTTTTTPTTGTTTTHATAPRGTPLATHDCPHCGAPVSLRQAALGKALLELAATTSGGIGIDIGGDCTPLDCIACLERGIADDGHRAELVRLKAFIDGLDALLT